MALHIVRNNIIDMHTDAIVNTANPNVAVGSGCDYAIYMAAGYDALLDYRRKYIGTKEEGDVFITPGFDLQASYIIHVISPQKDISLLHLCYRKALELAYQNKIHSIAFPLISTGSFGFPKEEGFQIAIEEIQNFLFHHEMEVYLVVFDEVSTSLSKKIYPDLQSYIDKNYVEETMHVEYNSEPMHSEMIGCGFGTADYRLLKRKLSDRIRHLSDSYSEYLLYLIDKKNMKNSDVYKRALVDKKLFAKIKNDRNYHPSKITCLQLCVGAMLNLDETKDLLSRAGYALSPCDMRDVIFSYFIENEIYDMIEIDIQLEEYGLPCIIE